MPLSKQKEKLKKNSFVLSCSKQCQFSQLSTVDSWTDMLTRSNNPLTVAQSTFLNSTEHWKKHLMKASFQGWDLTVLKQELLEKKD